MENENNIVKDINPDEIHISDAANAESPYYDPFSSSPPAPKREYKLFEVISSLICFAFGFGFIKLFLAFTGTLRIGLFSTIFYLGFEILAYIYMKKSGKIFNLTSKITMVIIALFCINLSISANLTIKILDIIFIVVAIIYWIFAACDNIVGIRRRFIPDIMVSFFHMPFHNFGSAFKSLGYFTKNKSTKNMGSILIGLVIALPITLIIGSLLISSDAMFENMFNNFFNRLNVPTFLIHFAFSIPVTCFLFSTLVSNTDEFKTSYNDSSYDNDMQIFRFISPITTCVSVTPVCILYVFYFFAQSQYFLSAFNNTLPEGYGYAEYARRGFFELCVVCIINLGIIIAIHTFSKSNGNSPSKAIKVYSIIISIFTLLLIATAISKMLLYIDEYGLTPKRIYTSWFMILLAVIFIFIIINQFKINMNIMKYSILTSIMFFALFSFLNIDSFIAGYNIKQYQKGNIETPDFIMMEYELSSSAISAVIPIIESSEDEYMRDRAIDYLEDIYKHNLKEMSIEDWNLYDYLAIEQIKNIISE